ncbi:MAG: metal ABC transporter substrate-binding protein [Candidatus Uhrbacteria bacterium]
MHQVSHLKSLLTFLAIILITGLAVVLIKIYPQLTSQQTSELSVAATIFPIYDIAKNVAGDAVKVTLILPPGADAHSFEPSPSLIKEISGAKVVYAIGGPLDAWSSVLATNVGAETITVSSGIKFRSANDEEDGSFDPHYWLSVKNAKTITANISADLISRWPEKKEQIIINTNDYLKQLETLDQEIRTTLQNLPQKNLVTFHDAWYYFAEAYDLTIAGTFEPTAGREPTPQYLANLISVLDTANVKTMYYEPQMSINNLETFARDYNISLAVLDDIGGKAPYDSYINLMKTNVSTLKNHQ